MPPLLPLKLALLPLLFTATACLSRQQVGLPDSAGKADLSDFAGQWKAVKGQQLTLDSQGKGEGKFVFPWGSSQIRSVSCKISLEVRGKDVTAFIPIGPEDTVWRLTLSKDKDTLFMVITYGDLKWDKITLTRDKSR